MPVLLAALTGCGTIKEPDYPETLVANLPGEDLAGPCRYALRVTDGPVLVPGQKPSQIPQTAVLVVFERLDSIELFSDPALVAAAQKLHMAIMYAYECDAKSFDDLQADASTGPGRSLFKALEQFSVQLVHPELAQASVFLTGFSAAGYLAITTASEFPDRVLGIVPYAPASAYYDIENVPVTASLVQVPALMLVSATDTAAGDQLPFFLFLNGQSQGAPWAFASQHSLGHCCVDSIAPILIPWMNAIFAENTVPGAGGLVARKATTLPAPPRVAFQIAVDGSFDGFGWQDFYFSSASISPVASAGEPYQGWLPDDATATAWLAWVNNTNLN